VLRCCTSSLPMLWACEDRIPSEYAYAHPFLEEDALPPNFCQKDVTARQGPFFLRVPASGLPLGELRSCASHKCGVNLADHR
jgi:hypothetical protein